MSNLVLFITSNCSEIIGKRVGISISGTFSVDHPLVIRPIEKSPGQYALDLFPHSLANPEGTHSFRDAQILSMSDEIPAHLEKAYLERTSSIILSSALDDLERMK